MIKSDRCLRSELGEKVDLVWREKDGVMEILPSSLHKFEDYEHSQVEIIKEITFMHSANCPFKQEHLLKNPETNMAPCVVVLLQNKQSKKILATQRHPWMTFGGQWVLPGGHL